MGSHRGLVLGMLAALAGEPALAGGSDASRGERYALLVGVKTYDRSSELRPLQYPERDMVELREALLAGGYRPENVVLMTRAAGAEETRFLPIAAGVRKELQVLLRDRTEADSVIVAFAGHGVQFRGEDQTYFCPADARLDDRETLISLREVYQVLDGCPARCKLLLSDACRNDPVVSRSRRASIDLASVSRPQLQRPPGGVAALFSCSEGELAYESDALKHGVFFHFVIAGLRGEADVDRDRRVELDELALFARRRVQDFVRAEYDGNRQMPYLEWKVGGDFPLVSVRAPAGAAVRKPVAPSPLPARAEAPALPPRIRIVKPREGARLTNGKVLVEVEAMPEDHEPVTRVQMYLNGQPARGEPYRSGPARDQGPGGRVESQWLILRPGRNVIEAAASNRARSSARAAIAVLYDPSTTTHPPRPAPRPAAQQPPYLGLVRHYRFTFMTRGVILGSPHYDSPAAKAGIKADDMLIRFNREPIDTWQDYKAALARCRPGQTVKVEVGRVKDYLALDVTLAAGKEDD